MRQKTKFFILIFMGFTAFLVAQQNTYNYKRNLENITYKWHYISLPDAMVGKLKPNLSDIRIYGITTTKDTIEAPYFVDVLAEKIIKNTIAFEIINTTKAKNGYYYTFKTEKEANLETLNLKFSNPNFDWLTTLEGSQNQLDWFTILEDYRIVSIKNESTDYNFSKLKFKPTKYTYYRLLVKSDAQPNLVSATLNNFEITNGNYSAFKVKNTQVKTLKKEKKTVIKLTLTQPYALSKLDFNIEKQFDYYRPLTIEYLSDSLKTEKGWNYYYKTLYTGTLSSFEANRFKFESTVCKTLRLTVYNNDNEPLTLNTVEAFGYKHQLTARFTTNAKYSLVYGNKSAIKPRYDILNFKKNIPKSLNTLTLGEELLITNADDVLEPKSTFFNTYWLWAILAIIIALLAVFTLKMMKNI